MESRNGRNGFLDIAVDFAGIEKNGAPDGRDVVRTKVMMGVNPEIEEKLQEGSEAYGFLIPYAGRLQAYDNQFIEFIVILAIALVVLAITLLASYIIRLSPFLGHYLFGVKYEK